MIARNATLRKTACSAIGIAALVITGCAKSGNMPHSANVVADAPVHASAPARTASAGKARAPVRVVFDRKQGLEPGQAEQIEVTLLPQAGLDNLKVDFKGSEGLVVQSGAHYRHPGAAPAATPVVHRITVSAAVAGRYRVSVVISTSVSGTPIARAIAVPILVGDVAAAARVQAKSGAEADSTGQRVEVLPGVRRTR